MGRKKRRKAQEPARAPAADASLGTFEALLKASFEESGKPAPSGRSGERAASQGDAAKTRRGPLRGGGVLSEREADALRATRAETPARDAASQPPEVPLRKLSPEELMAEAFEAAGDTARSAKFEGEGYRVQGVEIVSPEVTAEARPERPQEDDATGEDLLFAELMTGTVAPMEDRERYAQLERHHWSGARWHDEADLSRLSAEELREHELTPEQRELLKRARRAAPIRVLNVRHYNKREALGEVEAFVLACRSQLCRYVRVVHGKGRHSKGEAVLKPAVINWCTHEGDAHVVAWAPETDKTGQFGSIVLELVR